MDAGTVDHFRRVLDLRSGLLTRTVRWRSPAGHGATITFERFASLANPHMLCLRCRVVTEFEGTLEIRGAVNGNTDNEGLVHWRWVGQGNRDVGPISNICADWGQVVSQGLLGRRRVAEASRRRLAYDPQETEFLDCAVETIDAVLGLASAYAAGARRVGRSDLAPILEHVPACPARGFHEALQSLRICHAAVWLGGHYHVGLGRLDQYLMPFLRSDLDSGRLTLEAAQDLLMEFFISLNKDSDLYPGVQQGDNGQTITLGGVKPDGSYAVNEGGAAKLAGEGCGVSVNEVPVRSQCTTDTNGDEQNNCRMSKKPVSWRKSL